MCNKSLYMAQNLGYLTAVRLSDQDRAKLERLAESGDRTKSDQIRRLIREADEPARRRNPFLALSQRDKEPVLT